jgi:3-mercaptopyruvate sulfurtransferase SseA
LRVVSVSSGQGERPFSLLGSLPSWQRYLSTGYEEELKWYDVDTPEFARIVTSYQVGSTTAADVSLIDVRQPEELMESGKIPGTVNIPRKRDYCY